MTKSKPTLIDLFCGAGGFSTGFLMTGNYKILAGVDFVGSMERSFSENHNGAKFINYDIRKKVPQEILDLKPDVVIGSPPCQGFSDARGVRYRLDEKNDLVFHYYRWIDKIRPKMAIMENVKGMSTIGKAWKSLENPDQKRDVDFMELLRLKAVDIGYSFRYQVLNSKDYGTPQDRERVFCLMTQDGNNATIKFPERTHENVDPKGQKKLDTYVGRTQLEQPTTIREAVAGLPEPKKYENNNHFDAVSGIRCKEQIKKTWFQNLIFDSKIITNHVARYPSSQEELEIISRIPEGVTYRSDRKGEKHISVWELFKDQLSKTEQDLLKELNSLRTKKEVKTKKGRYSEGYVPLSFLTHYPKEIIDGLIKKGLLKTPTLCSLSKKGEDLTQSISIGEFTDEKKNELNLNDNDLIILDKLARLQNQLKDKGSVSSYLLGIQNNTLNRLVKGGWIVTSYGTEEVDYTAKAGHRGRFSRLKMDSQSRTLMTGFTSPREILHPIKNRGLSLREGARLMSFPDSFTFHGSFSQISLQIGNAVAPLVSRAIALEISELLVE